MSNQTNGLAHGRLGTGAETATQLTPKHPSPVPPHTPARASGQGVAANQSPCSTRARLCDTWGNDVQVSETDLRSLVPAFYLDATQRPNSESTDAATVCKCCGISNWIRQSNGGYSQSRSRVPCRLATSCVVNTFLAPRCSSLPRPMTSRRGPRENQTGPSVISHVAGASTVHLDLAAGTVMGTSGHGLMFRILQNYFRCLVSPSSSQRFAIPGTSRFRRNNRASHDGRPLNGSGYGRWQTQIQPLRSWFRSVASRVLHDFHRSIVRSRAQPGSSALTTDMGLTMLYARIALRTSFFPNSRFNLTRVEQDGSRLCLFTLPLAHPSLPLSIPLPHPPPQGGPGPSASACGSAQRHASQSRLVRLPQQTSPALCRPSVVAVRSSMSVVEGTRPGAASTHLSGPLRPGSPQRSVTGLRVYGVPPPLVHLSGCTSSRSSCSNSGHYYLSLPLSLLLALPLVYPFLPRSYLWISSPTSQRCCVCVPFFHFLFLQLNIVTLSSDQLAWLLTFFFIFLERNFDIPFETV